jgi:alkylated DNA nucleotide flippase Atl1
MGSRSKRRKSWQEKLTDSKGLPKVVKLTGKMSKRWGAGTCIVPAPGEVDEIMKRVPEGKLITINQIRAALAKRHGATISCPMTTGISASIAAHAAAEAAAEGEKNVTPHWRTLKAEGIVNPKYPGGVEAQKRLLEREGHKVLKKGKRCAVADFEKNLVEL